ncbi:ATP-dependent DNA helicase [Flammeovirga kamogawensis]|uniref:AAA family ATPase n=1 Tax=Flammeovirga kamogawensis TaxID=373891 RepID=A0ABX8GS85_9BACT|nr:AAA family ATPase [Flammeovirga kamogawensis]MBB6461364.1 exodeoxyribonuclease-5 [Flammeovirga kamogawensis]QWG06269.1 AAA family ATPase [Flammeovirga kamogawensis]TRX68099.1 AAA family ATPase [Flammeovirga kamogawensis]
MITPSERISASFPFEPTNGQKTLFELLDDFVLEKSTRRNTFLLKGYAGTGKTSVLTAFSNILRFYSYKPIMLAPTGRAAKVMSSYAKRKAFTIHRIIFNQSEDPDTGILQFQRQKNTAQNTVYIIDEASMVDDQSHPGGEGLLSSLINYVFEDPKSNNKLFLVGDSAQLPPVKQEISPALDEVYLQNVFRLNVKSLELTEVVRQASESGILYNATTLRNALISQQEIKFTTSPFSDIYKMGSDKLEDGLLYGYDKYGIENTVIITRSNRAATQYNQYIRRQIHYREEELDAGDYLMIVRNNYFWLDDDSPAGFLANGEFIEVTSVGGVEEKYGFRFCDIRFRLLDYTDHPTVEAKIILDTLHSFTPQLEREENRKLYNAVLEEHAEIADKRVRLKRIREDEYLNALQVKFSYALTCHKSQGGQWDAIFVDIGFLRDDMVDTDFIRWQYTAITRAKSELFLMNYPDKFFK